MGGSPCLMEHLLPAGQCLLQCGHCETGHAQNAAPDPQAHSFPCAVPTVPASRDLHDRLSSPWYEAVTVPAHLVVRVLPAHCRLQGMQERVHQPFTLPESPPGLSTIRAHIPVWPRAGQVTPGYHKLPSPTLASWACLHLQNRPLLLPS